MSATARYAQTSGTLTLEHKPIFAGKLFQAVECRKDSATARTSTVRKLLGRHESIRVGSGKKHLEKIACRDVFRCILRVKLIKIALEGTVVIDFEHYALTPPSSKRVAMGRTRLSEMTEIFLDRALGNLETRSYIFLPERQDRVVEVGVST